MAVTSRSLRALSGPLLQSDSKATGAVTGFSLPPSYLGRPFLRLMSTQTSQSSTLESSPRAAPGLGTCCADQPSRLLRTQLALKSALSAQAGGVCGGCRGARTLFSAAVTATRPPSSEMNFLPGFVSNSAALSNGQVQPAARKTVIHKRLEQPFSVCHPAFLRTKTAGSWFRSQDLQPEVWPRASSCCGELGLGAEARSPGGSRTCCCCVVGLKPVPANVLSAPGP